jgi:dTDP-4-dehydrorhamnose reductase
VTILVLGQSGQVARALAQLGERTQEDFDCVGRERCDLSNTSGILAIIEATNPSAIINAAAYTAVDAAETDEDNARLLNAHAPAEIASVAAQRHIPFIHLSTDYVFDGSKSGVYNEFDVTNPINVYGLTKREGEIAVLEAYPDAVILRTSWVYSEFGKNFLRTMLSLAKTRDALSIVDDQIGAPTSAHDIAQACLTIAKLKLNGAKGAGVFHMTGSGQTSWLGFASAAFDETVTWRDGKQPVVSPISTADYPTPARRPLNSRLNCDLLEEEFGIRLPEWKSSMSVVLKALASEFGGQK